MGNVSNEIQAKGEVLLRNGKVKKVLETEKRGYFEVNGESDVHSVIFDKGKKKWKCDCRYFTLNQKECSHIIASKMKGKT